MYDLYVLLHALDTLIFSGPQYDKYAASLFYIGRRIYK
jgi:hypothetical protein